jgi:hypothetical protein
MSPIALTWTCPECWARVADLPGHQDHHDRMLKILAQILTLSDTDTEE